MPKRSECVTPASVYSPDGFPPLLTAEQIETLRRQRWVVADEVLPPQVVERAQDEVRDIMRTGQLRDLGFVEVMGDEYLGRLILSKLLNIGEIYCAVTVHIQPQPTQRVDGDAVVRCPARIIGVIHKAPLTRDDGLCNFLNSLHQIGPSCRLHCCKNDVSNVNETRQARTHHPSGAT